VSITAIMTALAFVGCYSLSFIPDVELRSLVLFATAYIFGLGMAMWCTLIMSIVYETINPWGGFIPLIWLTQVIGWTYVVAAGAIIGHRTFVPATDVFSPIELGVVGVEVTIVFDIVTTIGYAFTVSVPFAIALLGLLPFMMLHVPSNGILFATVLPRLNKSVRETLFSAIAGDSNGELILEGEG
jgi:hypothetical protein